MASNTWHSKEFGFMLTHHSEIAVNSDGTKPSIVLSSEDGTAVVNGEEHALLVLRHIKEYMPAMWNKV